MITIITMLTVINTTMGSSLPSMAIPYMTREWGVTSDIQKVLPISTYLIGYVVGPLLCKPEISTPDLGLRFSALSIE